MSAITDLQATVQTSFAALSSREKRMVGGAAATARKEEFGSFPWP